MTIGLKCKKEKCFAYRRGECEALTEVLNPCPFYKHKLKELDEVIKTMEQIRDAGEEKKFIYYGGEYEFYNTLLKLKQKREQEKRKIP